MYRILIPNQEEEKYDAQFEAGMQGNYIESFQVSALQAGYGTVGPSQVHTQVWRVNLREAKINPAYRNSFSDPQSGPSQDGDGEIRVSTRECGFSYFNNFTNASVWISMSAGGRAWDLLDTLLSELSTQLDDSTRLAWVFQRPEVQKLFEPLTETGAERIKSTILDFHRASRAYRPLRPEEQSLLARSRLFSTVEPKTYSFLPDFFQFPIPTSNCRFCRTRPGRQNHRPGPGEELAFYFRLRSRVGPPGGQQEKFLRVGTVEIVSGENSEEDAESGIGIGSPIPSDQVSQRSASGAPDGDDPKQKVWIRVSPARDHEKRVEQVLDELSRTVPPAQPQPQARAQSHTASGSRSVHILFLISPIFYHIVYIIILRQLLNFLF